MTQQKLRYRGSRNAVAAVIVRNRKQGKVVKFQGSEAALVGGHYIASHPTKDGVFTAK